MNNKASSDFLHFSLNLAAINNSFVHSLQIILEYGSAKSIYELKKKLLIKFKQKRKKKI